MSLGSILLAWAAALSLFAAGPGTAAASPDAEGSPTEISDEILPSEESGEELADTVASAQPLTILLALVLGLTGGGLTGWIAGRITSRQRPRSRRDSPPVARIEAAQTIATEDVQVIDALVDGLVASHDLATNDAQRARVTETLLYAGVTTIEPPPLAPFDPQIHHALGIEQDDDPARAGKIARTVRPGWRRDGETLRPPEVTVYPSAGSEIR